MARQMGTLRRMCLEMLGLTLVMGFVIVIAAFHHFGGFAGSTIESTLIFCVVVLFLTALPIQIYAAIRVAYLQSKNKRLHMAATRDTLTGLMNRSSFEQAAEAEIAAVGRRKPGMDALTLLIVDADHFKRINDRLGAASGDQALAAIAAVLLRSVRPQDLVGRIGGEEFAVLLRNAAFDEARLVAETLRKAINTVAVGPAQDRMRLSVSVGGVTFAGQAPYRALYRAADVNLYKAKRDGRNRSSLSNLVQRPSSARPARQNGGGATRALIAS